MTLDTLDAAFLRRWQVVPPLPAAVSDITAAAPPSVAAPPAAAFAAPVEPSTPTRSDRPPVAETAAAPLLDRLLAAAEPQWQAIADRVEAARGRGRRVIAVAGHDRHEGRTTIVAAVAGVLRGRGRDVVVVEPGAAAVAAGPTHDKRIILVDAGVWFPPGPIRRARLLVASYGCEAALVVRRADRPAVAAIEAALEAIGVEPLGEVVTFVTAKDDPETAS
jgi:hypothetical protein